MKQAVNDLVDVIKELITDSKQREDKTFLCQVINQNDPTYYDLAILPHNDQRLSNVPNMTPYVLSQGDYCYVCAVNNDLNNIFICSVVPSFDGQPLKYFIKNDDVKSKNDKQQRPIPEPVNGQLVVLSDTDGNIKLGMVSDEQVATLKSS